MNGRSLVGGGLVVLGSFLIALAAFPHDTAGIFLFTFGVPALFLGIWLSVSRDG